MCRVSCILSFIRVASIGYTLTEKAEGFDLQTLRDPAPLDEQFNHSRFLN